MNRLDIMEEMEERYAGILPVEVVDDLIQKWFGRVQYNCCPEWNLRAFLDSAVEMGYKRGLKLLRANPRLPYGPENLYVGRNVSTPPPGNVDHEKADLEDAAERWNRCVYEFNRARVKAYRKREWEGRV